MKKYLLMMLVVLTGIVSSCKYDDDELWDNVDDLANRISALETLTKQMNGDIAAMQAIITALENQEAVSEVEKLTDGYILHFTNGTTATIKNGTDGKDGKDAPAVGLEKEGGVYYWTLTVDGKTEWLTDEAGNKLAVANDAGSNGSTGSAGRTPTVKVDEYGFWTVSYDGTNFNRIKDAKGNDVSALGTDGEPLFEDVSVSEDEETITIVMADDANTTYMLPLLRSLVYYDSEGNPIKDLKSLVWSGNNTIELTYTLELEGAKYAKVDENGVTINVDETNKKVTLTLLNNAVTDARGVLLFFNETTTLTSVFKFNVEPWNGSTSSTVALIMDENGEMFYPIATPADLAWVAKQVNNGVNSFTNETIKLLNNIDLNGNTWTPIGVDSNNPFSGTFDGNGKTITGLNVELLANRSLSRNAVVKGAGLFGVVNGATFKDITIKDAKVNANGQADAAGILVGSVQGDVKIENVTIEKETETETEMPCVQGAESVGGVVGNIHVTSDDSKIEILGCSVAGIDLQAETSSAEEGETASAGTVGGVIGSVTTANNVTITSDNLSVTGNIVTDATVVVPEGVDSDDVEFDSVVGNSSSAPLPENVKESIEENNANAEDLQVNGEVIIKNLEFAELLQRCYPDDVKLKNGYAVFSKEWAENLGALNLGTGWHKDIVVKTLGGIEKFPNITYFCCAFQGVEECDFSANPKLEHIYVHGNNLNSINVSKNVALKYFGVFNNPTLTNLDVTKCLALEYLDMGDTSLSSIDFSKNSSLQIVDARNVILTSVDFSHNPELTSINFSGSKTLSSLDLTGCRNLTSVNVVNTSLTALELEAPEKITLLSISGVKGLANMSLSSFTSLTQLGCGKLGWTTIGLTEAQKSKIINLTCFENNIEALDLSEYPNLTTLSCYGNRMVKMNASVLTNLKTLVCGPQQTGTLTLTLNDAQKELWNSSWKSKNPDVVLEGEQGETPEGTVSTYDEFVAALNNNSLKEIIIKNCIDIEISESLRLNFGYKKITVVDGFWDKNDAAINIVKSAEADPEAYLKFEIGGAAGKWKFNGSTNNANKYFIKSNAVKVFINNGIMNVDENLNALYVDKASCALFNSNINVALNSYAVDITTTGEFETMLNLDDNATVTGPVHFVLGDENGIVSSVNVNGGSSINGALIVEGNQKRLQVRINDGKVEGEGWSSYLSGEGSGGNPDEGGNDNPQGGNTNGNGFDFKEF